MWFQTWSFILSWALMLGGFTAVAIWYRKGD